MKEFVLYTGARFGIFFLAYAAIIGLHQAVAGGPVPRLWPLVLAVVLSSLISFVLLRGLRDRLAASVQARASRIAERTGRAPDTERS